MAGRRHNHSKRRAQNLVKTVNNNNTLTKSKKTYIISCPYCNTFVNKELGLKIHIAKKHEDKKSVQILCAPQEYGKLKLQNNPPPIISSPSSNTIKKGQLYSSIDKILSEEEEDADITSWCISNSKAYFAVTAVTCSSSCSPSESSSSPSSSKMLRHREDKNLSNNSKNSKSSLTEVRQDPVISCKYCSDEEFYEDKFYKLHMQHWHSKKELLSGSPDSYDSSETELSACSDTPIRKSNGNSSTPTINSRMNDQSSNGKPKRLMLSITTDTDGKTVVKTSATSPPSEASKSSNTNQTFISYKCTHCNYCTKNRPELTNHMTSYHKVKTFPCPKCSFVGLKVFDLMRHACPSK